MGQRLRAMGKLTSKTTIVFGTSVDSVQTATTIALSYPDVPTTKIFKRLDPSALRSRRQEFGNVSGHIEYGVMLARTLGDFESDMPTGGNLVVIANTNVIRSLYAAANPTVIHNATMTQLMPDDAQVLQPGWAIDITADPLGIANTHLLLRS